MYYMSFPKDRRTLQFLVFGLFLLETVQTVLITHDLFTTYAFGWGDTAQLGARHLEPFAVPITNGIGKRHYPLQTRAQALIDILGPSQLDLFSKSFTPTASSAFRVPGP